MPARRAPRSPRPFRCAIIAFSEIAWNGLAATPPASGKTSWLRIAAIILLEARAPLARDSHKSNSHGISHRRADDHHDPHLSGCLAPSELAKAEQPATQRNSGKPPPGTIAHATANQ